MNLISSAEHTQTNHWNKAAFTFQNCLAVSTLDRLRDGNTSLVGGAWSKIISKACSDNMKRVQ